MPFPGDPRTTTAAWRKLRCQILDRDRWICHVCHKPGADQVDHLVPVADGGTDNPNNLAAIHDDPCHRQRTAAHANETRWWRTPRRRPPQTHPGLREGGG